MNSLARLLVGLLLFAVLPSLLLAQATVTTFSAYTFENTSSSATFYSDSSDNGHGFTNYTGFGTTSTNLAPAGGSYAFSGAPSGGLFAWNVSGGTVGQSTNWGIELLFKNPGSTSGSTPAVIFSVGNPDSNGLAIVYNPATNRIQGQVNGQQTFGSAEYNAGAWNSAVIVNNGTTTTLWLNSIVASALNLNPTASNSNWHAFVNSGGGVSYTGQADNIRVFTFTGTYTAANISAIPEPSTFAALLGLGTLGWVAWRRRNGRSKPDSGN